MVIWSQLPLLAIDSMSTKRFLAMLFAANILTGCAVGPDYVRPTLPMPDRFQGQAEVDQRPRRPTPTSPPGGQVLATRN